MMVVTVVLNNSGNVSDGHMIVGTDGNSDGHMSADGGNSNDN